MKDYFALASLIMFSAVFSSPAPNPAPPGAPLYVVVNIDGNSYDVSSDTTTFATSAGLLQTEPWWGSPSVADQFAVAVGQSLGTGNQNGTVVGPLFNFAADVSGLYSYAYLNTGGTTIPFNVPNIQSPYTFAVATYVGPVPEASASPALLAAAGLFVTWRGWRTLRPVKA